MVVPFKILCCSILCTFSDRRQGLRVIIPTYRCEVGESEAGSNNTCRRVWGDVQLVTNSGAQISVLIGHSQ